jgi:hypothetical protein
MRPATVEAKRGCETTFSRGETIVICTKGAHREGDSHHGSPRSNGAETDTAQDCKVTGSAQTNTC